MSLDNIIEDDMDDRFTSLHDPIKIIDIVHIVNKEDLTKKGRLSISMAPGKKDYKYNRDLKLDLETIKNNNINVIVCLLEWHEMELLTMLDYPYKAQELGLIFYHLPIKDQRIPTQQDASTIVSVILKHLGCGENVLVHCRSGLGRAGTICACCLINLGYDYNRALETVRRRRPGAIPVFQQEEFILKYSQTSHEAHDSSHSWHCASTKKNVDSDIISVLDS